MSDLSSRRDAAKKTVPENAWSHGGALPLIECSPMRSVSGVGNEEAPSVQLATFERRFPLSVSALGEDRFKGKRLARLVRTGSTHGKRIAKCAGTDASSLECSTS